MTLLKVQPKQDILIGGAVRLCEFLSVQCFVVDRDALQGQLRGSQGLGGIPAHAEGYAGIVHVAGIISAVHGLAVHIQDQIGSLIGNRDVMPLVSELRAHSGGIDLVPASAVAHEGLDRGGSAAAAGGDAQAEGAVTQGGDHVVLVITVPGAGAGGQDIRGNIHSGGDGEGLAVGHGLGQDQFGIVDGEPALHGAGIRGLTGNITGGGRQHSGHWGPDRR